MTHAVKSEENHSRTRYRTKVIARGSYVKVLLDLAKPALSVLSPWGVNGTDMVRLRGGDLGSCRKVLNALVQAGMATLLEGPGFILLPPSLQPLPPPIEPVNDVEDYRWLQMGRYLRQLDPKLYEDISGLARDQVLSIARRLAESTGPKRARSDASHTTTAPLERARKRAVTPKSR